MGSKPTEVFQFCPDFLALIPYHLVMSPETDLNHYLVRNAREGGGDRYQKDYSCIAVLIYTEISQLLHQWQDFLARPSTETTFLSLVNNVFLKINTGQMPTCLRELSVSDASTCELLLTHGRGTGWTQLPKSRPGSHRVS